MNANNNRLVEATSAYLRQHAHQPVDWYPWGPEALDKARNEGKPILLSIGYAACHWCHVMAQESFDDPDTAAVMNENFVSIKVDREERPDLDHIYQAAHQLLARQPGGWPLTMFLTADQAPFFSGTYFPRESRFGLPGFRELLQKVATAHAHRQGEIAQTGAAVREALARLSEARSGPAPGSVALNEARQHFRAAFDLKHGGLGRAPKFPRAAELDFCLAAAQIAQDSELRQAVLFSLRRIAEGGLQDHLRGGFFRYCVDGFWDIPHFEKMLYDNALLLRLYADAYAIDGDRLFQRAAEGIVAWLLAEMRAPEGLFYSSLDADAEHEEGKYYVWTREAFQEALPTELYPIAAEHFGLSESPNFEGRAWHLRISQPVTAIAERMGKTPEALETMLQDATRRLLAARAGRVRPGLDDKRLTAWNALLIGALARAARVFARQDWLVLARQAHAALLSDAWANGRLSAVAGPAQRALPGYLDDYAFLLEATLELMESDYRQSDYDLALELAGALLQHFRGEDGGGFFFTAADHEPLLARMRTGFDQATPAGNGVVTKALLRLWHLCSEPRFRAAADETLGALAPRSGEQAEGQGAMLSALLARVEPTKVVWMRGTDAAVSAWQLRLPAYRPDMVVLSLGELGESDGPSAAPPPIHTEAAVVAWVCREGTCSSPMVNFSALLDVMDRSAA